MTYNTFSDAISHLFETVRLSVHPSIYQSIHLSVGGSESSQPGQPLPHSWVRSLLTEQPHFSKSGSGSAEVANVALKSTDSASLLFNLILDDLWSFSYSKIEFSPWKKQFWAIWCHFSPFGAPHGRPYDPSWFFFCHGPRHQFANYWFLSIPWLYLQFGLLQKWLLLWRLQFCPFWPHWWAPCATPWPLITIFWAWWVAAVSTSSISI